MNYLNRENAPLDGAIWDRIDATAVEAASALLTGRRFLPVDGPHGLGLTTLEVGNDNFCRTAGPDEAAAIGSHRCFCIRDVA